MNFWPLTKTGPKFVVLLVGYPTYQHLTILPQVHEWLGNHYSLRAEHEKAVKYFRRAIQLDRTYLSAWTLMGHEYVEMKNSHAAIEAYRRAIGKGLFLNFLIPYHSLHEEDVNRKDYRAWYGLGQAYELLSMHYYALHYYQRATALRSVTGEL